ncbi:hypothetical protein D3C73_1436250 [compost metagenome]
MLELKAQDTNLGSEEAFAKTIREHRKLVDLIKANKKSEAVQLLIQHLASN